MRIAKPSFEIMSSMDNIIQDLEKAGRVCYKSEDSITPESASKFVRGVIRSGHEAVIEHRSITVKFIIDRGVSHELVRHRLFSFCQESTRYCNYSKNKFGNELTFIEPYFWEKDSENYKLWEQSCLASESIYLELIKNGAKPEEARSVLPNSLKTEIVVTGNMREWRHYLKLRCAKDAHPQIREVSIPLRDRFIELLPELFEDLIKEDK